MIHCYLRASTNEQNAERAKETLIDFAVQQNVRISRFHIETVSGRIFDRPVLMQLIENCNDGDILLIEQIDRLTRLTSDDWELLKIKMVKHGLKIVSMDLPTSYAMLKTVEETDPITQAIMKGINSMMLDVFAAMASKDYIDRRTRQAQGISRAQSITGKYIGKQQTIATIESCKQVELKLSLNDNLSQIEACKLAEISISTYRRWKKVQNELNNTVDS